MSHPIFYDAGKQEHVKLPGPMYMVIPEDGSMVTATATSLEEASRLAEHKARKDPGSPYLVVRLVPEERHTGKLTVHVDDLEGLS